MTTLGLSADELLTTTRSVRKRLDFDRSKLSCQRMSENLADATLSGGMRQASMADNFQYQASQGSGDIVAAEQAAEAEAALADAEAQGSGDADAAIADANAKAEAAEAKAATAEAKAAEAAAAPAAAPSSGGNMTLWTIVALILGLVVGGGAVFFTRKS